MDNFLVSGRTKLKGVIKVSGAKNVAMKVIIAGLLTDKPIFIKNVPLISSVYGTAGILRSLGVKIDINSNHTMCIKGDNIKNYTIPLELGGLYRTATMVMGPLLARFGRACVPNPGGCRLGKRPIERHIDGLKAMGAHIVYKEGYFYAYTERLKGVKYRFSQNTHTGTESMIFAAVLAEGETILENAASEPEIDDLINLLNLMGAQIRRIKNRTIVINGVAQLSGVEYEIMPDRNEVITFAIGAIASGGDLIIEGTQIEYLKVFLSKLDEIGAVWESLDKYKTRFSYKKNLVATDILTLPYPGFMTDWQAPWSLLMTQAQGQSIIHETIYEDRFGYVTELSKMGADIKKYNPKVKNPGTFYNFNWSDRGKDNYHAITIDGPTKLHNAVLNVTDLRAGATLVMAALIAEGKSMVRGIEHIDRGYENIEQRLNSLGAVIKRMKE